MRKLLLGISQLFFLLISACGIKGQDYDQMVNNLIDKSVPVISSDSLFSRVQSESNLILLDARAKDEYEVSHLENAIWVGYKEFELEDLKISTDKNIVIYCSVGYRSEKIGEKLEEAGYKNVKNLHGGIFGWVNNGYALVDGSEKGTIKIHPYNNSWGKWLTQGEKSYE